MSDRSPEHDPDDVQHTGPTIRDKRRVDPATGQVREPQETADPAVPATDAEVSAAGAAEAPAGSPDGPGAAAEVDQLRAAVADRTADLQRLQAEYVNYKRRVDRDRDVARVAGVESVLRDLLSVLDNVRSAREHEELSPGFRAVADDIERVTTKHGLVAFGQAGDAFDPRIHEALMHAEAAEVDGTPIEGPTCITILQSGYKVGERVVRPARVAVAEPAAAGEPAAEPSEG